MITVPCKGGPQVIQRNVLARWEMVYGSRVDVMQEIAHAIEWLHVNPKRRKASAQRYLSNWLRRAAQQGRQQQGTTWEQEGKQGIKMPSGRGDCACGQPAYRDNRCGKCWVAWKVDRGETEYLHIQDTQG